MWCVMKLDKIAIICILLISMHFAYSQTFEVRHAGYLTQRDIMIQITNTGNTTISDMEIYVDGNFYEKISINIPPGKSVGYIISPEPGDHKIEIRYQNESRTISVSNFVTETPSQETNKEKRTVFIVAVVFIFVLLFSLVYTLLKNKTK
jgi:hypothetical protein